MAVSNYEACINIIKLLELHTFFPKKITRQKALTVKKNVTSHTELQHPRQIPWFMLENLIAGNYEGRSFELSRQTDVTKCKTSLSRFLKDSKTSRGSNPDTIHIHSLDVLTALFLCCDDFLRQILVEKLSLSQLGIPLLLPVFDANPQTLELLLWATSTLRKQWKTSPGSSCERSMAVHPLPIVSALRLGRPRLSKSNTLNKIFNNQKHDPFFHSGCKSGSAQKILSNGMLEITWYLPMGNDRDYFPEAFGIMNLRGNAHTLKKQIAFMTMISSTTIVFCTCDKLEKEEMNFLTTWNNQNSHLIIVFDGEPVEKWGPILESVNTAFSEESKKVHLIVNDDNEDMVLTIRQTIKECIACPFSGQTTPKSLENCEEFASKVGIRIDDKDTGENFQSKMEAVNLVSCLEFVCHNEIKDTYLPLQLISSVIATKKRELLNMKMRGKLQTELYAEKVTLEIKSLREKQMMVWRNRSELMKRFMALFSLPPIARAYFLQWTSILLDRYSSHHLQLVRQEYNAAWQSQCHVTKNPSGEMRTKTKLDDFRKKLFDFSVGIENLNREMAQIYEMALDLTNSGVDVQQFPEVAVEMLLDGHPLELMDGDATYVPLKWLNAVLTCLKSKVGNARMFVLSVLGVQGTGKSTMLNTMFGLKFAVSAGRCTKGAFAQLIPLDQILQKTCKCDYILVIDTEGLRAPEFASTEQSNRDNEMATFVIGLADATIINIMGESQTDMQDILQIVVYTFMKMKSVNLKPSCLFVHQNVNDVSASVKSTTQKIMLRELLDKTTKMAAEVQRFTDTCISFTDVINFQENKHVAYISSLWKGDPPMAPPNPGYSKCILQLRKTVLKLMDEVQGQTIDEFKCKITDLWEAVLCENFIFSFKNTLEILAYSALETEYIQVSRDFRKACLTNCNALVNACNKIPADKMETNGKKILDEYLSKINKNYKTMFDKMKEYLNGNPRAIHWEVQIKDKMSTLNSEVRETLKNAFKIVKQSVIWKAKIDKDMMKYELDIRKKSRELAEKFKDLENSEVDLRRQFDISWKDWIEDIPVLTNCVDINVTLERIMLGRFEKDSHVIRGLLQSHKSVHEMKVTKEDIQRKTFLLHFRRSPTESDLKEANCLAQVFRNGAISFIDHHKREGSNCNEHILKETVDLVSKQLTHLPDTDNFVFTDEGIAKNTFCILWSLLPEFQALQSKYRKQNEPRVYMASQREKLWHVFKNECSRAESTVFAVCKVSFPLAIAIAEAVKQHYMESALDHFRTSSRHRNTLINKRTFHAKMLIDLAETRSFEVFKGYLSNPSFRMSCWLQEYIINALQNESDIKGTTVVENLYHNSVRIVYKEARTALENATKHIGPTCKLNDMWEEIINHFRLISVTINQLHILDGECEIRVNDFFETLSTELNVAEIKINEKYKDDAETILKNIVAPAIAFFEKDLIGCQEMCPFCKAPCDNFDGCKSHRTVCHRPQGVGGQKWDTTNKLVVDLCTTAVRCSEMSFRHSDVDNNWHKFVEYRNTNKHFKSWNIEPMVESQLYWKWFMKTYNHQLAEFYGCEKADIPESWRIIEWEIAKIDLLALYT